jgi:hypothetical protein
MIDYPQLEFQDYVTAKNNGFIVDLETYVVIPCHFEFLLIVKTVLQCYCVPACSRPSGLRPCIKCPTIGPFKTPSLGHEDSRYGRAHVRWPARKFAVARLRVIMTR